MSTRAERWREHRAAVNAARAKKSKRMNRGAKDARVIERREQRQEQPISGTEAGRHCAKLERRRELYAKRSREVAQ